MPKYRLSVVAKSDRSFLVGYSHKIPNEKVDGIVGVIDFMSKLKRSILRTEPCYQNIRPEDQEIIEGARQNIIGKKSLEIKASSST